MCHHGVRSADVTVWLRAQGWGQTFSLRGGIDAYALLVDPSIGRYY
jgi:rhodanese-related sulfurtransferase